MDIVSLILAKAICGGSEDAKDISYDNSQSAGLISTNVNDALDELSTKLGVKMVTVSELPEIGEENILYIVPKSIPEQGNFSDEYTWDETEQDYDKVGDTLVSPLPAVTSSDNGKLLGVVSGAWDKVKNPNDNIASAYDSTSTYAVGDLCIHNNDLYECNTTISVAEAWDSTHWTQVTINNELDKKANMSEIENRLPVINNTNKNKFICVNYSGNALSYFNYKNVYNSVYGYLISELSSDVFTFVNSIKPTEPLQQCYDNRNPVFLTVNGENKEIFICGYHTAINIGTRLHAYRYINKDGKIYYQEIKWDNNSSSSSTSFTETLISDLPSATSSNANNILNVNSIGNYELIKPYIVNFNVGISNGVCSFYDGKKPSDVYAIMYGNGVHAICFLTLYSGADNVKFLSCKFNSSNNLVAYTFYEDSGDLYYEEFVWSLQSSADSSSHTKRKIKELPTVTSSDESKVLTVNSSGEWVAQDLPDGTNISY